MLRETHSLCLLQQTEYAYLYDIIGRYLSNGYAVIYAAEPNTDKVLERMARAGIDVEQYFENGMLKVMSLDSVYISDHEKNLSVSQTLESWHNIISRTMDETKAKGILAIGSTDAFIQDGQEEHVKEYEDSIGKRPRSLTEAVCCYDTDSFSDTSVSTLIAILNAHEYTIHYGAQYAEWKEDKLQSVLASAFNKVLGSTTSDLMLKTLKSVYKIDEKTILSDPEVLESAVAKFFKDSSPAILAAVLKDLKTEIAFRRQVPAVSAS
ncbi:hypothetical protein NTE_00394 [Candidatus Nitrososphaera evergladensis SR1]|uniref:MEDS domain-containing protein n=1 Tax=Candidatus Nitrososphaera evergladensis SR1 TaxID=1459636 RepID=A0A075MLU8_9ARCH|nr:MEDS domain-containing protein [Candidatus Nitrososphaera evergladensis]AIF82476.1 hypothetical protein NTE_00394 [Candidatus Nitrososphaera evergladensis SR1]